jgi:hypothetical protein
VWRLEDDPGKRRRPLATLFDRIWQDGGTIVAVKSQEAFMRYFQTADELPRRRQKKRGVTSGSDGTRTRALPPRSAYEKGAVEALTVGRLTSPSPN